MNILKKQLLNNSHTKLLVHPTGADSSTTFLDNSSNPKTITVAGNACIKTQNLKHPYAKSAIFFNGSSYLSIPDSVDFNLIGDFTFETFVYLNATTRSIFLDKSTNFSSSIGTCSWRFEYYSSNLYYEFNNNGSLSFISVPWTPLIFTWYHISVVRKDNTGYFFVNGGLLGTSQISTNPVVTSTQVSVGYNSAAGICMNGYLLDLRLSIGTDRGYTGSTISVPTSYLTSDSYTKLLISGNEFQEYLATEHTGKSLTLGPTLSLKSFQKHPYASIAGYFDGSGDYLSTPYTSDFTLASGDDFTIEAWVYRTTSNSSNIFNNALNPTTVNTAFLFMVSNTGILYFNIGNGSGAWTINFNSGTNIVPENIWTYVGVKRLSGITTLWINGAQVGSISTAYSSIGSTTVYIQNYSGTFSIGFLADFRFSKGIARDLSVIPTSPLTSDSYTKLLLPMSTSGTTFTDTTGKSITTYGDAKQITCQPGNIDRTLYFAGNTILTPPAANSDFYYSTNNFTWEFWVNFSSSSATHEIYTLSTDVNNMCQLSIRGGTGAFYVRLYSWVSGTGNINIQTQSNSILPDTWNHVAIVRYGTGQNNLYIFINGLLQTLTFSTALAASYSFPNYVNTYIGYDPGNSIFLTGNLAWFHVINGTALYTSSFIAPQNPVVNSNTKLLVYPGKSSTFFKDSSSSWNPKIITSSGSTKTYSLPASKSSSYFDGTGDYLTIPTGSNNFLFADKDLTIHCWVNLSSHNWCVFHTTGTNGYAIYGTSTQTYIDANGTTNNSTTNISLTDSIWHHIAFIRKNNIGYFYKDGNLLFNFTCTANNSTEGNIYVGAYAAGAYETLGYIKDFTVVKGQALWTKNFNPPTRGI